MLPELPAFKATSLGVGTLKAVSYGGTKYGQPELAIGLKRGWSPATRPAAAAACPWPLPRPNGRSSTPRRPPPRPAPATLERTHSSPRTQQVRRCPCGLRPMFPVPPPPPPPPPPPSGRTWCPSTTRRAPRIQRSSRLRARPRLRMEYMPRLGPRRPRPRRKPGPRRPVPRPCRPRPRRNPGPRREPGPPKTVATPPKDPRTDAAKEVTAGDNADKANTGRAGTEESKEGDSEQPTATKPANGAKDGAAVPPADPKLCSLLEENDWKVRPQIEVRQWTGTGNDFRDSYVWPNGKGRYQSFPVFGNDRHLTHWEVQGDAVVPQDTASEARLQLATPLEFPTGNSPQGGDPYLLRPISTVVAGLKSAPKAVGSYAMKAVTFVDHLHPTLEISKRVEGRLQGPHRPHQALRQARLGPRRPHVQVERWYRVRHPVRLGVVRHLQRPWQAMQGGASAPWLHPRGRC